MSSAAAAAAHEYGAPADDQQLLHHHHHHHHQHQQQQIMYHVPQYSRREKLRFPPDDAYYSQNTAPQDYYYSTTSTFDSLFSTSNSNPSNNHYTQPHQPFTLTLSSPPPPAAAHPVRLGLFTGYTTVLSHSRYVEPARQLLDEIARDAGGRAGLIHSSLYCSDLSEENFFMDHQILGTVAAVGEQQQRRKTRLISMLDEVYRRYKHYNKQVQTVISLFESVPGLSSAAPCASMALKVMSKQFRYLKNVISEQLHHINKTAGNETSGLITGEISTHRMANDYSAIPHVWRPQRGLPERAVAVLRAWLFEHFLHPYPTDADKQMLATQTGLTRNQVSNWFINARVRLWKPMVEEVHSLEIRQQNNISDADNSPNIIDKHAKITLASTATSSRGLPLQNHSPRDDLTQMSNHIGGPYNLVYDGIAIHRPVAELAAVKGNGDVSLALGLHQHNSVCVTEPLPMSVRRFGLGLEECNDAYVIGSLEGQGRNFEKYINGHYFHDFVG